MTGPGLGLVIQLGHLAAVGGILLGIGAACWIVIAGAVALVATVKRRQGLHRPQG